MSRLMALIVIGCLLVVSGCTARSMAARFEEEPTISLYMHETGEIRDLQLEEYIKGVVAAEMDPTWPEQALGAQAILARTFTIQQMLKGKTKHGTDASTDHTEFQAYDSERIDDRVSEAVEGTKGEIVVFRGKPIAAYFHSCSGGMTASGRDGLNLRFSPRYLIGGVEDPPCANEDLNKWSATFSLGQVATAAREAGARIGSVTSMTIARKGDSGHATVFSIGGRRVNTVKFRMAIGPDKMKSTLLTNITVREGQVVMEGRGWGHGVGMSQYGAFSRAENGDSAEDIVRAYYPRTDIKKLY